MSTEGTRDMRERIELLRCDKCGTDENVCSYEIISVSGQERRLVELCEKDSKPLLRIAALGRSPKRGPRDGHEVAPIDPSLLPAAIRETLP